MKEFYGLLSEAFRAENTPTYELDGGALHGPSPPPQASKGLDIRHFHVARVPIDHVGVKHRAVHGWTPPLPSADSRRCERETLRGQTAVLHLRWRRSSSLDRAPLYYFSRGIVCRHSLLQACATRKRARELAALFLPSRAPKVPRRWEASAGLRCTVDDGRRRCTVEGAKAPARAPRARARARARGLRAGSLQGEVAHLIIVLLLLLPTPLL